MGQLNFSSKLSPQKICHHVHLLLFLPPKDFYCRQVNLNNLIDATLNHKISKNCNNVIHISSFCMKSTVVCFPSHLTPALPDRFNAHATSRYLSYTKCITPFDSQLCKSAAVKTFFFSACILFPSFLLARERAATSSKRWIVPIALSPCILNSHLLRCKMLGYLKHWTQDRHEQSVEETKYKRK